jgi:RNA polymerase sigma-70 factor (ECF subfamily)
MAPVISWAIPATSRPEWELTVVRPNPGESAKRDTGNGVGDADLVAACLRGEAGAFDLVVARHQRSVYQLCYRFVGNHEDASDLSQDVFVRAYRGLRNFRGQSSVGTWLYRIAVNVCLNRAAVKRPPSEPIDERQHVDTTTESPSERVLRAERAERVRAAIAELPPKQRAALILRMYQDMSHQDIAAALGSSVGAVKANVFHALQNLKKILGRDRNGML